MKSRFHISFRCIVVIATIQILFLSCQDGIGSPDDKREKERTEFHLAISISNEDFIGYPTRDGDEAIEEDLSKDSFFKSGIEEERKLSRVESGYPHFAIIFNETGEIVGDLLDLIPLENSNENGGSTYQILYGSFTADNKIKMEIEGGKILVVLNAPAKLQEKLRGSQSEYSTFPAIKEIVLGSEDTTDKDFVYYVDGNTRYFTMSSSMIVKGNDVVPANMKTGDLIFYPSRLEAITNPYRLFVEPLQSKFTLLFQQGDNFKYFDEKIQNANGINSSRYKKVTGDLLYSRSDAEFSPKNQKLKYVKDYKRNNSFSEIGKGKQDFIKEGEWSVLISGWGVNGIETSEYLFKHLESGTNYFDGWINSDNSRNYWSEDPHYTISSDWQYPVQYRFFETEGKDYFYEVMRDRGESALRYFSFNSMEKKEPHQYSPENTFSKELLESSPGYKENNGFSEFLTFNIGSHLIVTARLIIEGFDSTQKNTDISETSILDKYYLNGIYWSENAYKEYTAEYLGYRIINDQRFKSDDGIFYKDENGNRVSAVDFNTVSVAIKGGDAKVCIEPKETTKIFIKRGDEYKEIDKETFNNIVIENLDLMAYHFKEGMMYYPVAIEHNRSVNSDSEEFETGDYGVVRNHWYLVTVNSVLSPGIPVDNPEEEIVPNAYRDGLGLGVNIRILDWHKVEISTNVGDQPRPGYDVDIKTETENWNHYEGEWDEF